MEILKPKVTWVVLFWNRVDLLRQAMEHNIANTGVARHDYELVMVDNGSVDGATDYAETLNPETLVKNHKNLGVAKGYNRGMVMATGEFIVITGMDMLMPDNWMRTYLDYFEKIPDTGVVSMYSGPLSWVPERARGGKGPGDWVYETINGLPTVKGMPFGRRMFRTDMLKHFGYFYEGLGLYGYEDVHWGFRAEQVCDEMGLRYYVIPDKIPQHLGTEGIKLYDGMDGKEYHAFKQREANDPEKHRIIADLGSRGWPIERPFP